MERGFLQFPASSISNEPGLALSLLSLKINNPIGNNMSNAHTAIWLEAAKTNFEEAVEEKNWHLAQSILQDLNESGFEKEANKLAKELL